MRDPGRVSPRLGLLLGLLLGPHVASCGGAPPPKDATRVQLPGPFADRFSTREEPPAQRSDPLREAVLAAALKAGQPLRYEGRLERLAGLVLQRMERSDDLPPRALIDALAHQLGLTDPLPQLHLLPAAATHPATLDASLQPVLQSYPFTHVGLARAQRSGQSLTLLALSARVLRLTPIARRQPPAQPIRVQGVLAAGYANPRLEVRLPDGSLRRQPAGAGPDFDVRIATAQPGVYLLEILADGPAGAVPVATFPVAVGVEPPRLLHLPEAASEHDRAEVQALLLQRVNSARQSAGLRPLLPHAAAAAVAARHATAQRDRRGAEQRLARRAKRAGLLSGLLLESHGRGTDVPQLLRDLTETAVGRANMLHPDVTHVGFGVVADLAPQRGGLRASALYLRLAEAVDLASAPQQVLERLNRSRGARGAAPLNFDQPLVEAAGAAAQAFFQPARPSERETVDGATARVKRFSIAYERVGAVMATVQRLDEVAALEPALDASATHVGIGVAQGDRPDTGPRAIAVVIVLGWSR